MTLLSGALVTSGLLAVGAAAVYIWKNVPVFQCPNCQSYNVDGISSVEGEYQHCFDCLHEWRGE